jgi:hypothetical protein
MDFHPPFLGECNVHLPKTCVHDKCMLVLIFVIDEHL